MNKEATRRNRREERKNGVSATHVVSAGQS